MYRASPWLLTLPILWTTAAPAAAQDWDDRPALEAPLHPPTATAARPSTCMPKPSSPSARTA